jgi:hypothetical protein
LARSYPQSNKAGSHPQTFNFGHFNIIHKLPLLTSLIRSIPSQLNASTDPGGSGSAPPLVGPHSRSDEVINCTMYIKLTAAAVFSLMPLPENEGYRYCPPCERWVAATNLHCSLCAACPSKDGRTYRHCTPCGRCVKPTYEHCPQCNRCFLAGGHTGCDKESTFTNTTCKRSADVAKVTDDDMAEKRKRSRKKKRKGKEERE